MDRVPDSLYFRLYLMGELVFAFISNFCTTVVRLGT